MIKVNDEEYMHSSFFHECENANTIVIFIHGILESPTQFEYLAKSAFKNRFSVSGILLDGHGCSAEEFSKSSLKKWIDSVDRELESHRNKYENIIIVGHSMGSLLCINAYMNLHYRDKIKSMVLIGTPLNVWVKPKMIKSSIKIVLNNVKESDFLTYEAHKAFSVKSTSLFTYIKWIPRYLDLFILINRTKKNLSGLDIPMLIVHGVSDELVSCRSLDTFTKKIKHKNYKVIRLENSGHFYYDKNDLKSFINEFNQFLDQSLKNVYLN